MTRFNPAFLAIIMLGAAPPAGDETRPAVAPGAPSAAEPSPEQPPTPPPDAPLPSISLSPAFPNLTFIRPVFMANPGDGSNRLFVVEQPGRIKVFENRPDATQAQLFFDARGGIRTRHNEEGLLSLVFHPKFKENGQFFIYYSASDPKRNVISRFTVMRDDPSRAGTSSEQIILEVEQPYGNHNGSTLLFGPDGFLYASLGDGGLANDPHDNGQNLGSLLAKVIRIDVDRTEGSRMYAVPPDNPFVGHPGARPEIWAYGLRNIWRMSFDRATGELWAGDVGQNKWEEIDLIIKGGNYGWNFREGFHPFRRRGSDEPPGEFIDPVIEYPRDEGISVTGGYVYRGSAIPQLRGAYVYGDYASGRIWALRRQDGRVTAQAEILPDSRRPTIASFAEDAAGELYICSFDRADAPGVTGRILKLVPR